MKKQNGFKAACMLVFFIFSAQMAGILGSVFTAEAIPGWYAAISKPSFTPPGWLFGPVWLVLYTFMGVAAYLVWKQKGSAQAHSKTRPKSSSAQTRSGKPLLSKHHDPVRIALLTYTIQLGLNALWSIIFFGGKSAGLAFAEILLLWVFILLTTIQFWRLNKAAGALFVPYLLWVTFAAALNYAIWQLN